MPAIAERHATQAGFLWTRREAAAGASHYHLAHLAELDERLEAHLDGVRVAGAEGARAASVLVDGGASEGIFVAADRALDAKDVRAFAALLDLASGDEAAHAAVASALAWLPPARVAWAVDALLHPSCPPELCRLGIAAKAAHRIDPGDPLVHALWGDDPLLRRAGLVALGQLGKRDLLSLAQEDYAQSDDDVRVDAAWAGLLLGDPRALDVLGELAAMPRARLALARAAPAGPTAEQVRSLLGSDRRAAIDLIEASLDARFIPTLLEHLGDAAFARIAARTLATLTGIAVEGSLAGPAPSGADAGPNDDPKDKRVASDPDAALPWPAPLFADRVSAAAKNLRGKVLWGQSLGTESAALVLREGNQRERAAAALELALARPGAPLVEVRAPGFRQTRAVG